jgi:hypothetical protein
MKTILISLSTVLISYLSFGQTDVKSQIEKFRISYADHMLKGNASSLSPFIDDHVRLMPEFQMTVKDKQNVLLYYGAFHKRFSVTAYSRESSEILDLGKRVVEWGQFTQSIVQKATKSKMELRGKYMDVWIKGSGDKLTLVTQAWNYNHDINFADSLKFNVPTVNIASAAHTPVTDNISFELAGLNELMESIIIQHDARRWKMFYSDDGNFLYSRSPVFQGRKALDQFIDDHVIGLPIFEKLDIRNDQIDYLGEYVIEYASHTAFVRGEGWSGTGTGKDIRVWRREKDCALKIFRHIGMYD